MIVQPQDMKFNDKTFSCILYGAPGVGKTTLACSAETPLLIDLDKGVGRVRAQHRVPTSVIDTFEELLEDIHSDAIKEYKTIIVDTGGALITFLKDYVIRKSDVNCTKSGGISQKGFGAVKQEFTALTDYIKTVLNKNVVYVFHTEEQKDKDGNIIQRLLCEGSAKNIVWQPCDFGGYVYMNGGRRVIAFAPTSEYFAKGCYGINNTREVPELGTKVKNDFLMELFREARENIAKDSEYFETEKKKYDAAMELGKVLIEEITDVDKLNEAIKKYKEFDHALTSEIEIKHMIGEKVKELGCKWYAERRAYVSTEKKDEAQDHTDATE